MRLSIPEKQDIVEEAKNHGKGVCLPVCIVVYLYNDDKSLLYYMSWKTLGCSILLLLSITFAQAQQRLIDSLITELNGSLPDSSRAMSMMRLAVNYEAIDTAKAYRAYENAIKFASEKKLYYQLGRIYQNQSVLYTYAGNYARARAILDTAILNYRNSDHPRARVSEANAYGDIGNVLRTQNKIPEAADYYLKSIAGYEALNLPARSYLAYSNLSSLFGDMGEQAKQLEYAQKSVSAAREGGARQHIFISNVILANAYNRQGDFLSAKKALDSARLYFNEEENADNIDMLFSYYLVSGDVFKKNNQHDSALYYFTKSLEISNRSNYSYGKAESQLQMGAIAIMQKNYDDAEKYLSAGIKEAQSINSFGMLDDGYKYMSDIYAVTGRYKEAYEYFQKFKEMSDSVLSMESKKYATELEKKYETEKKDKQIILQQAQLRERRFWIFVLIGAAVTLVILSLLLYRNYQQKQKIQQQRIRELEKEQQLLAVDAVLRGEEQERSRLAKDLHDGLGGMLSGIKYSFQNIKQNLVMTPDNHLAFERGIDMLNSSIKEMRRVAHNMMPESLVKFGLDTALQDFCNDINQSGAIQTTYQSMGLENVAIDQTTSITVYRIVQELINNTLKHAGANTAIVQVFKSDSEVSITVEDDGKGFDPLILQMANGIGWSNIQSRVDFLKGKVNVQSEKGKGTSVHIELNV